jgi:hypothetical protein
MKPRVTEVVYCARCGKPIGRKLDNGTIQIMFGRKRNISEERKEEILKENGFVLMRDNRFAMEVVARGFVMIRCSSPYCDHTTVVFT